MKLKRDEEKMLIGSMLWQTKIDGALGGHWESV